MSIFGYMLAVIFAFIGALFCWACWHGGHYNMSTILGIITTTIIIGIIDTIICE